MITYNPFIYMYTDAYALLLLYYGKYMLAIWLKYIVSFPDPHVHQGRAGAGHETVTITDAQIWSTVCHHKINLA